MFLALGCGSLDIVASGTELWPRTCLPVDRGWAGPDVEGPSLLCMQVVGLEVAGIVGMAAGWVVIMETGQPLPVKERDVGGLDAFIVWGQD